MTIKLPSPESMAIKLPSAKIVDAAIMRYGEKDVSALQAQLTDMLHSSYAAMFMVESMARKTGSTIACSGAILTVGILVGYFMALEQAERES